MENFTKLLEWIKTLPKWLRSVLIGMVAVFAILATMFSTSSCGLLQSLRAGYESKRHVERVDSIYIKYPSGPEYTLMTSRRSKTVLR